MARRDDEFLRLAEENRRLKSRIRELETREQRYRATLYGIGDGMIATDDRGVVTQMNRVAEQLTGWREAEALNKPLDQVFRILCEGTRKSVENPVHQVLRNGEVVGLANHTLLISRNGSEVPVADSAAPILDPEGRVDGVVLIFRDQSSTRLAQRFIEARLALSEFAASNSLDSLLTRCLDRVGEFVDSPIGFYHFVDPDQKTVSLQQWSTRTLKEFCQAPGKGEHYPIDQAGVWVDCVRERRPVIHNDYRSLSHKKGLPEGHAEVVRELVVPVMRENRVVAILGVGNKPSDYTQDDVEIVSYLADLTWEIVSRKRADEKRMESEARFATLFQSMLEGVCLHELVADGAGKFVDYRILDVNPAYESILSVERSAVINRLASEIYATSPAPYLDTYVEVVESGCPARFETYFPPMDKHFLVSAIPMGEKGFATAFSDISELKRTELRLVQSERKYRTLYDKAPLPYQSLDPNGCFLDVNPAWLQMLGYDRDEVIGTWFGDYLAAESQDHFRVNFPKFKERGSVSGIEFTMLRNDGDSVDVEFEGGAGYTSDGKFKESYCVFQDVTSRKLAYRELEDREGRLRILFEQAGDSILVSDSSGRIVQANEQACRSLGYRLEEIVHLAISEIDIDTDIEKVFSKTSVGSPVRVTTRHRRKDGSTIPVEVTIAQMDTAAGTRFMGISRDISERVRSEKERALLEAQIRQIQSLESVGRLAGGVAHDLNNMLSPILGYSELLLAEIPTGEDYRESLQEILGAGLRARDLVQQLLAFGRKQKLEFKHTDLNRLVLDFEKLLRRTIREDISIALKLGQSVPPIRADGGQLEQVLMNLVVNAEHAMPHGGHLTIQTESVYLDEESAASHQDVRPGAYVMLSVEDTGIGMAPEVRDRIFEPFFTTKEEGKGTGLGLATVYGIVKQHQGSIWVCSEPGQGSTFKVFLPVAGTPECAVTPVEEVGESVEGTETILLVEDAAAVRRLAGRILRQNGYQVLEAENGKQAIELCHGKAQKIHLLLTDVVMPGMNGREVYEQVSALHPGIRVIFMSGYAGDVISSRGVMGEDLPFINKPFNVRTLLTKVREVLD